LSSCSLRSVDAAFLVRAPGVRLLFDVATEVVAGFNSALGSVLERFVMPDLMLRSCGVLWASAHAAARNGARTIGEYRRHCHRIVRLGPYPP